MDQRLGSVDRADGDLDRRHRAAATIAVAATNKDVCAFGRWAAGAGAEYVTMAHVKTCRAIDAPTAGWAAEAGGAASDLPDDNG